MLSRVIAELQAKGLTLLEIARRSGESAQPACPEPSAWWQYRVADDVVVTVRADVSPWRMKQIRKHLSAMAAGLREPETKEKGNRHER